MDQVITQMKQWLRNELINQLVRLTGGLIGCKFPLQFSSSKSFNLARKNGAGVCPAPRVSETNSCLLRAGHSGMRQDGFIREAERAVNGIGGRAHLKPLQQRNVLQVVGEGEVWLFHGDWYRGVGQYFNRIAFF